MLIHKKDTYPGYRLERESWREYFCLSISPYEDIKEFVPKGFIYVNTDYRKVLHIYWRWYLIPFVKFYRFLVRKYLSLSSYLYNKGIIEPKDEGNIIPWYWLFVVKWKILCGEDIICRYEKIYKLWRRTVALMKKKR